MEVINLKNAKKVPFNLDGHLLFNSEKADLVHLCLHPGQIIERHSNPIQVVFFVLEGEGTFFFNEREIISTVNDCFTVLPGELRGWQNHTANDLKLLVFKLKN